MHLYLHAAACIRVHLQPSLAGNLGRYVAVGNEPDRQLCYRRQHSRWTSLFQSLNGLGSRSHRNGQCPYSTPLSHILHRVSHFEHLVIREIW